MGFIAVWFLAASPMRRSESVNATYEGVVRAPWSLAMISTLSWCHRREGRETRVFLGGCTVSHRPREKKKARVKKKTSHRRSPSPQKKIAFAFFGD
jgi:hypothetical protein